MDPISCSNFICLLCAFPSTFSINWETEHKNRKTSFRILIVYLLLFSSCIMSIYCIYTIEIKFKPMINDKMLFVVLFFYHSMHVNFKECIYGIQLPSECPHDHVMSSVREYSAYLTNIMDGFDFIQCESKDIPLLSKIIPSCCGMLVACIGTTSPKYCCTYNYLSGIT